MAVPPSVSDTALSDRRLKQIGQMEETHFWFVSRRALLERLMTRYITAGSGVLDIGCGTGSQLRTLADLGYRGAVGLELSPLGLNVLDSAADRGVRADATMLPFRDNAFDAVLLLDVLEHIEDGAAISEVHRALKPRGTAIITVPAHPWLWSRRDDDAGHLRRYTRPSLRQLIANGGFELVRLRYFQSLLFPLFAVGRLLRKRSDAYRDREEQPSSAINSALLGINLLELRAGRAIDWLWGSSLVAVVRKP